MSAKTPPLASPLRADKDSTPDVYDDGYLRVEHDNYYVTCGDESLKFPRTEFLLLSRLVRGVARFVKAEELWRHAWGNAKPYNAESVHVHIYRLRHKLAPFGIRIETMINVGYRLLIDADSQSVVPDVDEPRIANRRRATS